MSTNDPKKKRIDLRGEKLNKDILEKLKQAIDKNFVVGYIHWGEIPTDCQELKKQIEETLINNICTYFYHPNDYVHGLLAMDVYNGLRKVGQQVNLDDLAQQIGHKLPANMSKNWKVAQVKDDSKKSGFYSVLYVNEYTHQVVLSFKGTKDLVGDLVVGDVRGVLGNVMTRQQELAYAYGATKVAIKYSKQRDFNLSITGQSLGGYLAVLSVFHCYHDFEYKKVKGVVFDSPGAIKKLKSFESNLEQQRGTTFPIEDLPLVTYLSVPNLVNICDGHLGEVYSVSPEFNEDVRSRKYIDIVKDFLVDVIINKVRNFLNLDKMKSDLSRHGIVPILTKFEPKIGKPKKYVRMESWPQLKTDGMQYIGHPGAAEGAVGSFLGSCIGIGIGAWMGRQAPPVKAALWTVITTGAGGQIGHFLARYQNLGVWNILVSFFLDLPNVDRQQYLITSKNLLEYLNEFSEDSESGQAEYMLKYGGGYRRSILKHNEHILNTKEKVDALLYDIGEHKKDIEVLIKDYTSYKSVVLKFLEEIIKQYEIEDRSGYSQLTITSKLCMEELRDRIQRALEIFPASSLETFVDASKSYAKNIPIDTLGLALSNTFIEPTQETIQEIRHMKNVLNTRLSVIHSVILRLRKITLASEEIAQLIGMLQLKEQELEFARQSVNVSLRYIKNDLKCANKKLDLFNYVGWEKTLAFRRTL